MQEVEIIFARNWRNFFAILQTVSTFDDEFSFATKKYVINKQWRPMICHVTNGDPV